VEWVLDASAETPAQHQYVSGCLSFSRAIADVRDMDLRVFAEPANFPSPKLTVTGPCGKKQSTPMRLSN
jgi:hypothetical protein